MEETFVKICGRRFILIILCLDTFALPVFAQRPSSLAGDYVGMLGPMHVKLHLQTSANGTLSATVDNPDANLFGLVCADIHLNGQALSFTVPNVHGAWTGFVGADGNSLSGIYNQGQPMPLNWTRAGTASPNNPAQNLVPTTPAATPPSLADAASSEPACPTSSMGNYWDGSSWKPLTTIVRLQRERGLSIKEQLKNPINPMAAYTTIYRYKDAAAAITLGPTPRFCFTLSVNTAPNVVIGELDVKKNEREIEMKFSDVRNAESGVPAKKSVEADVRRMSPTSIEVLPKNPLHPGQYVINSSYMAFDFGVQ
jgi:hypothetical protein